jgi:hypothetical protein
MLPMAILTFENEFQTDRDGPLSPTGFSFYCVIDPVWLPCGILYITSTIEYGICVCVCGGDIPSDKEQSKMQARVIP